MTTAEHLQRLLQQSIALGASDVYLISNFPPAFKVNNVLQRTNDCNLTAIVTHEMATLMMSMRDLEMFVANKECNFAYSIAECRFRVNASIEQGRTALVLRKIDTVIPTLAQLQLPAVIAELALTSRGLILVVGPTGSGKTTTLAAMVNHRNVNSAGYIASIEDPIEYLHTHKQCIVSQREIGTDTHDWQSAIKSALRQAPNMVLIGEIRDATAMEFALQFAETGHLCLATIHASSALQAIERVANLFPTDKHQQVYINLSINLRAIIAQRLIPAQAGGCIAAIEVLLNTATIADYLFKNQLEHIHDIMANAAIVGMQTFDQALFELYQHHHISYEEALKNADSVNNLKLKLKLINNSHTSSTRPLSIL